MEHAFDHAHFRIYDNSALVTSAYVKALKEGESQQRVVAGIENSLHVLSPSLVNA